MSKQITILFLFLVQITYSQRFTFTGIPVDWNEFARVKIDTSQLQGDISVLDDKAEFKFSHGKRSVGRLITLKINNEQGLSHLQRIVLPESFDPAYDKYLTKQGRGTRMKVPFVWDYRVKQFAARRLLSRPGNLSFELKREKIRWQRYTGEFVNDENYVFRLENLVIGNVIQIYYEAEFEGKYGSGQFYFHSEHQKKNVEYTFSYTLDKQIANADYLAAINISSHAYEKTTVPQGEKTQVMYKFNFTNLAGINAPANLKVGSALPHVYIELELYQQLGRSFSDRSLNEYTYFRPKNFEWIVMIDTSDSYQRIYDRHFADLRKFVSRLPAIEKNGNNKTFFKALCDTINQFRYITNNQLYYNEKHLYDLSSTDHLLKRRLVGSSYQICKDIFNDNGVFYYSATVQDRRLGEHQPNFRAQTAYERHFFAVPNEHSYIYFLPRTYGVRYYLNELPFYLEGSLAALLPKNYQKNDSASSSVFKFIVTHRGTFNENARTENASIQVDTDKQLAQYKGKTSLSGQFSTVLRHHYTGDLIDSTINPAYFTKSVDKPSFRNKKTGLSSKMEEFPFRHTFNCSAEFPVMKNEISLRQWFNIPLGKAFVPESPKHDFYFDFDLSDVYNLQFDFNKPVQIHNKDEFTKKISNEYFEFERLLEKMSDQTYLLKVKLQVKVLRLPSDKIGALDEIVAVVEETNQMKLRFE